MRLTILLLALLLSYQPALGEVPTGSKRVWFEGSSGEAVELGRLEISRSGDSYRFQFFLEEANFSDQFSAAYVRPTLPLRGDRRYR